MVGNDHTKKLAEIKASKKKWWWGWMDGQKKFSTLIETGTYSQEQKNHMKFAKVLIICLDLLPRGQSDGPDI